MFFDKKILLKSHHLHPSIYKGWGKTWTSSFMNTCIYFMFQKGNCQQPIERAILVTGAIFFVTFFFSYLKYNYVYIQWKFLIPMVGILHMTSKVLYSLLGKASTKGNDQKKCKVLLKDAQWFLCFFIWYEICKVCITVLPFFLLMIVSLTTIFLIF